MKQEYYSSSMPRQKLPLSDKTEEWAIQCVEAALKLIDDQSTDKRGSVNKKLRNFDLYNGKFDFKDLEYVTNPLGINNASYPATMQYYDLASPIINLLIGEEMKRPFAFNVVSVNEDAISNKEETEKDTIMRYMTEQLQAYLDGQEPSPESLNIEKQIKHYSKYSQSELRESIANKLLNYLYKNCQLEYKFSKGWEDVLLAGEEIYAIEEVAGEPKVRKCNTVEMFFLLDKNSDLIDDSDIIVEVSYMPVGQIIDTWYDVLDAEEIDELESDLHSNFSTSGTVNYSSPPKYNVIEADAISTNRANGVTDESGNIRVSRVTWKSRKKIGILSVMNPETGETEELVVDETYKINKELGEAVEWLWVNEYWQAIKLGEEIYKNIGPKKHQFRSLENLSECKSGYVGTVYNANNSQSVSLMDRLVPYLYLYTIVSYRTQLALAKNLGKIALIDRSLIPDDWEPEKWFYYAQSMGFGIIDSYNEGKKGERSGKFNQSTQNKSLDLETGNYINQHIQLLQYIETQLENLSGVTRQRKGQITSSELVGNTERAVIQSNHITEKWFQIHNWTKQRVLETLLRLSKEVYAGATKKLQYIADDMTSVFFTLNGTDHSDNEYGLFVTNSSKDNEALNFLKQHIGSALQSDKIEFSAIASIINSQSLADIKHTLREGEEAKYAKDQSLIEQQSKANQELQQEKIAFEQEKMDREDYNREQDRQNKIQIAEINVFSRQDELDNDGDGIPDPVELAELSLKERQFESTRRENENKNNLEGEKKRSELAFKEKELQMKKEIENKKIEAIRVQNASQERMQKKQGELKEKELQMKERIERLKIKNKPKPKK